jgi:hypothetical protein
MWPWKRSQDQTDTAYDAQGDYLVATASQSSRKWSTPHNLRLSASTKSHNRIVTLMILPSLLYLWQRREGEAFLHWHYNHLAMRYADRRPKSSHDWPSWIRYMVVLITQTWPTRYRTELTRRKQNSMHTCSKHDTWIAGVGTRCNGCNNNWAVIQHIFMALINERSLWQKFTFR